MDSRGDDSTMKPGFFHRRIIAPIVALLTQGITPEKIALSLACGIVLGIFPVLGSTTILCAAAAVLFGLNLPAIQLVNSLDLPDAVVLAAAVHPIRGEAGIAPYLCGSLLRRS